jgi:DNA-binding transcriptional LysR family regulator
MVSAVDITNSDLDTSAHDIDTVRMDLRQLRTFEVVARTGSFTAAAAELAYTQSAVSQHIAALESAIGRPLLTRRPVALTPAGTRLAAHARHILLRLDVARTEIVEAGPAPTALTVVATPTAFTDPVADLLRRARARSPSTGVHLQTLAEDECIRHVADGRADAALVDGITTTNQPFSATEPGVLARHLIAEQPILVLLPSDHPLAGCAGLDLAALRDARWIDAPHLRCEPGDIPGHPGSPTTGRLRYDSYDVSGLVRLVANRLGLALLPQGLLVHHPNVIALPLRRPAVRHRVELVHLPGRAHAVRTLTDSV